MTRLETQFNPTYELKSNLPDDETFQILIQAELNRDLNVLEKYLGQLKIPDSRGLFAGELSFARQAELYRLYGTYLAMKGKYKSKPFLYEQAKDYFSLSRRMFEDLNDREAAVLCQLQLGFTYFQQSQPEEFEIYLNSLWTLPDLSDTLKLRLAVNKLIIYYEKKELLPALKLIERFEPSAAATDERLAAQFFCQAGLIYRQAGLWDDCRRSYRRALILALKTENFFVACQVLNNRAYLLQKQGLLRAALSSVKKAIRLAQRAGYEGFLGNYYDTKGEILVKLSEWHRALEIFLLAEKRLLQNQDFSAYCQTLFNKIPVYFALHRELETFAVFAEIHHISSKFLSEATTRRFLENFASFFFPVPPTGNLSQTLSSLSTFLMARTAATSGLSDSASLLGVPPSLLTSKALVSPLSFEKFFQGISKNILKIPFEYGLEFTYFAQKRRGVSANFLFNLKPDFDDRDVCLVKSRGELFFVKPRDYGLKRGFFETVNGQAFPVGRLEILGAVDRIHNLDGGDAVLFDW